MPELPEVETIRRGLAIRLEGRALRRVEQRRPDLRFPIPADFVRRVTGRRVAGIGRRAKYLLVYLDDGTVVICHLGMSGRLFIREGPPPPPATHDHVIFHTDDGASVTFADPRRFGLIDLADAVDLMSHPRLAGLGLEPLGNEFSGAALAARLAGRRTPIKAALLNQSVVAGLGNIYVCEALYRAGLSPRRSAHTIAGRRADRLADMVKAVLEDAIAAGGSTLRDYVGASGELGYFQHRFRVYGREGADCLSPGCAAAIRRIVQSGRSTFFCAACQR